MTVSIQPVLNCVQYKCSDNRTPLLPPDSQWCVQKGSSKIIDYDIITEARDAYRYGMEMSRNKYNLRKYLRGGVYRNIFKEKCNMIDVRDYGGRLDLNIKISENEYSIFKIRDISHHSLALRKIKRFNERCSKESIVRGQSGDLGSMFAFGLFNKKAGDYVSMKKNSENVREYQIAARKLLDGFFSDEIDEIIEADRKQLVIPSFAMGGEDGISAYSLVSRDLINSGHYDLDRSVSMTIFNERIVGEAKDWCFVLPNTIKKNDKSEKAIVINLFDGIAICWDGRKIFHATGTKDIGKGNHTYGNFWGGKVYR